MNLTKSIKIPKETEDIFKEIINLTNSLSNSKLNTEYADLAIKLAAKLARKRPSPLHNANANSWAAGIIHALGMVNFLFDKTQTPHITSSELCEYFKLGQSTVNGRSKMIRDMLKISQLDLQWTLPSNAHNNPLAWMISIDGFIIDIRNAPRELQQIVYQKGLIPFIPE